MHPLLLKNDNNAGLSLATVYNPILNSATVFNSFSTVANNIREKKYHKFENHSTSATVFKPFVTIATIAVVLFLKFILYINIIKLVQFLDTLT